jgi:hypothetical protein
MEPFRSGRGVDPTALLAAACLFAGLGIGLTGLSLLADVVAGSCTDCTASLPDAPSLRTLAGLAPTLAGAALASAGGWLFGRCR